MKISKNFEFEEFCFSQTALQLNIDNKPDTAAIINITRLCDNVMQKIRDHFQAPVLISSAFRCEKLNNAVGGAKNSQHLSGQAVDFTVQGYSIQQVFLWCKDNLLFDQLILEKNLWVHISFNYFYNRREVLRYDGSKYLAVQ